MEGNTIMEVQNEKYSIIEKLIEMFYNVGCSKQATKTFITNNIEIINTTDNITDKLYFILNNKEIYGIILVIENNYQWSLLKDMEFKNICYSRIEHTAINCFNTCLLA